jgi:hypothetical protein
MNDEISNELFASLAIQRAETRTALAAVQALLHEIQQPNIQGLPSGEWVRRELLRQTQAVLVDLEQKHPGAARIVERYLKIPPEVAD